MTDWNKVNALATVVVGLPGIVTFLVTIWPYPQVKAWNKKQSRNQKIPRVPNSTKVIFGSLAASILLSCIAIYSAWTPNTEFPYNPDVNAKREIIKGKTFDNERVVIDGKDYQDCVFRNVTFKYNGTTPIGFDHNQVEFGSYFETDNRAISNAVILLQQIAIIPASVPMRDMDRGGFQPPPQNAEPPKVKEQ
jgi:hypothetical protein